jgi:hypothetical protein
MTGNILTMTGGIKMVILVTREKNKAPMFVFLRGSLLLV